MGVPEKWGHQAGSMTEDEIRVLRVKFECENSWKIVRQWSPYIFAEVEYLKKYREDET